MVNAQPAASCPDENALAELVQGLLDDVVAGELEVHLDGCAECRRIVSSVGQSSYVARRTRVDSGRAEGADAPTTWSMGAPPTAMKVPEAGAVLAGKYRVEGLLGQGGMGVVMAAMHLTLGKRVAIKLMRPDLVAAPGATQRFVREARAASLLRSEHIARVIDLDTLDDGTPYIAMEYLEGEDLGAVLARRGTVSAHEAATYIVQVCDAIAEAHAANIVHRDLKPANLFITQRANTPCVKVLDFGVSKIIAGGPLSDDVASTDTKSLVGSPHYMAPEQLISAKAVDPRSDIWALGCILFELVSGKSPFATGAALAQVLASILRDPAPPLRAVCPALPDGFAAVVERCLDKDPSRRYQRVEELAAELVRFTTAQHRQEAPPFVAPQITLRGFTPPPQLVPASRRRSRRGVRIAIAAVATIALAIAGYVALSGSSEPAATPAPVAPHVEVPVVAPPPPPAPEPVAPAVTPEPAHPRPAASPAPRKKPAGKPKLEDDLIGPTFQ